MQKYQRESTICIQPSQHCNCSEEQSIPTTLHQESPNNADRTTACTHKFKKKPIAEFNTALKLWLALLLLNDLYPQITCTLYSLKLCFD